MYSMEITVGFLWYSQLRNVLEGLSWNDPGFSWKESRGWLDRTFYVKGPGPTVLELENRFRGWCSRLQKVSN